MIQFRNGVPGGLKRTRFVLLVAILLVLGGWVAFAVPTWAALAGIAALLLAALLSRLPPSARAPLTGTGEDTPSLPQLDPVLAALPHPLFLLAQDGTVRLANSAAVDRFPATRPGDSFTSTFRSPEIRAALEDPREGTTVEFREPARSGRTFLLTLNPVAGNSRGEILVTVDDASERTAIARMRADFVANASHELRTPLASISGFIETLLGPARNDPVATERFLRVMEDQAGRMRRLIDDLLSLSRAEMREHRPPTGTVDIATLVREVTDSMQATAAAGNVSLSTDAPTEMAPLVGDKDELTQVLVNLIENAIRYGGANGRVTVRIESRGELSPPALAVVVEDNGPGIAPEHVPRLTERFYRVDVGTSRDLKGTGLGLAIVKHILTRHGARLEVESRPGEGARFAAVFPTRPAAASGRENS